MKAWKLMTDHRDNLIGMWIMTERFGGYIGGPAKVIAINPDPNAPEIVIQVDNPKFGEMGIFDYEDVSII
jgi:hypothetical protein